MKQENFSIVLESQLGQREGLLRIAYIADDISGMLNLLGQENPLTGTQQGTERLLLYHHLKTAISDLECRTVLRREENRIIGKIFTKYGSMELRGTRLSAEAKQDMQQSLKEI